MNKRMRLYITMSLLLLILSWEAHVLMPVQATDEQAIPEESIRLRILANSNSPVDQTVKREIRNAVNAQITEWVEHIKDIEEAREIIRENLEDLNEIVAQQLAAAGSKESFQISLQKTSFPTKLYGNRLYPAGEYEAVLITLGDGNGDNWWCVLFPPLCFLDFSNGDAVDHEQETEAGRASQEEPGNAPSAEKEEDVQVSFFIVEIFTNFWDKLWS
nr:stage II sporulation protein R [Evansella caseinilytica]